MILIHTKQCYASGWTGNASSTMNSFREIRPSTTSSTRGSESRKATEKRHQTILQHYNARPLLQTWCGRLFSNSAGKLWIMQNILLVIKKPTELMHQSNILKNYQSIENSLASYKIKKKKIGLKTFVPSSFVFKICSI